MTTKYREPPSFLKEELWKIANYLMTPGKGILALDQSNETLGKRLEEIDVQNNEENRRKFREIVLFADEELGNYLSGIILPPEAFYDPMPEGLSVVQVLRKKGIVTGIKLEIGLIPLVSSEGECSTAGLTDLADICHMYKDAECHFAKWRCVYRVGENVPSPLAIANNAEILARFASICQYSRLVPIIEPEILPEGNHTHERAQKITEVVLAALFKSLNTHHVYLEGVILKVNFITPGQLHPKDFTIDDVVKTTMTALARTVPPAIMGIVFLAGGSCEDDATAYLDAITQPFGRRPWPLSFSFGRGMLTSTLIKWGGSDENMEEARKIFMERARINSLASLGIYEAEKEKQRRRQKKQDEKDAAIRKMLELKKLKTHRFEDDTAEAEPLD